MRANLITIAERGVLIRAAVAAGLILAVIILACVTATSASACTYDNSGRVTCGGTATVTTPTTRTGAGRPAGCPRLWCGCWARLQEGIKDPRYNLALAWLDFQHVGKQIGAWAVMSRGKRGGHVGKVVAIDVSGNPVLVSGNHGGRVGVGTYPARRIIAYVRP